MNVKSNRGGFTLVEVLAAALLLSIGLLAVMTASSVARDAGNRATKICIARNVAQSKIDEARSITTGRDIHDLAESYETSLLPKGNLVTLTGADYLGTPDTSLFTVTATVTWPEARGARTIRHETLVYRP